MADIDAAHWVAGIGAQHADPRHLRAARPERVGHRAVYPGAGGDGLPSGWLSIIGVILNYANRWRFRHWLESHFRWQIRTFCLALLWLALAARVPSPCSWGIPVVVRALGPSPACGGLSYRSSGWLARLANKPDAALRTVRRRRRVARPER